ncbi:MAG: carboxymuconolactone decarboxylase family protein, partial [Chloroflexi bacterium]|nr:carboxymuconolactone decarboxylase family protein [Chloroflexota bacterium]
MARLRYVNPDLGDTETLGPLVERIREQRSGKLLELYRMLLHSPPVADGWLHLGTAVRYQAALDGRSRELAICRVGQLNGARYEWDHHVPLARREGVSEEQLEALSDWPSSVHFDARQRALLAYADAMTRDVAVPDEIFDPLTEHFDEREVVELTATIA